MSRFNTGAKDPARVINYEGADSQKLNAELELYTLTCSSMLADKFYESADSQLIRLLTAAADCNPQFVANLAVYARKKMHLRSVPLILAVWLCVKHGGSVARSAVGKVIRRADELSEALAIYGALFAPDNAKRPLQGAPHSLIKGLRDVFEAGRFDEYQYGKYKATKKSVKLRDALFLAHPKPRDASMRMLFEKIAGDSLAVPDTWEVELSKNPNKKQAWERLIQEDRLGYMALLRNLRNILQVGVGFELLEKIAERINSDEVYNSKQLPFRFWAAYRELEDAEGVDPFQRTKVLSALSGALERSVENINGFQGRTLIACDTSGSMKMGVSSFSSIQNWEIGVVLGCLLSVKRLALIGQFGTDWELYPEMHGGVLERVRMCERSLGRVGWATNGHKVLQWLCRKGIVLDDVAFFTDCQLWANLTSDWRQYKSIAPNAKLWVFDLAGYGTMPVQISDDVRLIAGWSDKVFDMVHAIENSQSILEVIKASDF